MVEKKRVEIVFFFVSVNYKGIFDWVFMFLFMNWLIYIVYVCIDFYLVFVLGMCVFCKGGFFYLNSNISRVIWVFESVWFFYGVGKSV